MLREPNDISSYAALACIAIQSNQNDQHGGQSVCDFDYGLAVGVGKTYRRLFKKHVAEAVDLLTDIADDRSSLRICLPMGKRDRHGCQPRDGSGVPRRRGGRAR